MKFILTIYILLLSTSTFAQVKPDTLFIGVKKYALQKTKIFQDGSQDGNIMLPSEYKEPDFHGWDSERQFNYKAVCDSSYGIKCDEEGNEIHYIRWDLNCDTTKRKTYYLNSFLDTLRIKADDLGNLKPYIKSKGKKIFFCASRVDVLHNDSIFKIFHYFMPEGNIFAYWTSYSSLSDIEIKKRKASIYILRDIYYKKGDAIYYLDRKFVIKLE
jgi:hypothetical protein